MSAARALAAALLFSVLLAPAAGAAWTKPNKKQATAWQGFQDSANGAVTSIMPWNWFGARREGKYTGHAVVNGRRTSSWE